jgi:hypothetical protein
VGRGFVSAGGAGDDGTVEVLAELGEDRLDAADCLAQAGGDRLAGPLGGAGAQGAGASGESGGAAQLGEQGGPLIV